MPERRIKDLPGHLERRLETGAPRHTRIRPWEYYDEEGRIVSGMDGGMGLGYPASLGGFGENSIQKAIDVFKSSLWSKMAVVGASIAILWYVNKRAEGR